MSSPSWEADAEAPPRASGDRTLVLVLESDEGDDHER
jgi:hypothetical protein